MTDPVSMEQEVTVRRGGRTGLARLVAGVALSVLLALGPQSVRAQALSQRGHVFLGSFTVPGSDGGMSEPEGVAVNEATGDVYVVDRGENRIDRFGPDREFLEAWGWGVVNGEAAYQQCSSSCRPGLSGHGKYQLEGAQAIAVDNSGSPADPSAGDVYVEADTTEEHGAVDKFSASGTGLAVRRAVSGEKLEELHGLTVDGHGAVWIYDEEDLYVLSDGEPNQACPEPEVKNLPSCPGFRELEAEFEGNPLDGMALAGNHVYVGHEALGGAAPPDVISEQELIEPSPGSPQLHSDVEELDHEEATGLAGEDTGAGAGDVFLDNSGNVAVFDPAGRLVQRLAPPGGLQSGTGVAVDSSSGVVYVADRGAGTVDFFGLEGEGPPSIGAVSVQDVGTESAQLDASIDPTGAATGYSFRIAPGPVPGWTEACSAPCREVSGPGEELAATYGEDEVSVEVGALAPGTGYRVRVSARNSAGGHSVTTESQEAAFRTQGAGAQTVADARDWELVSPPSGGGAEALTAGGGVIQAARDGRAITYVADAPSGEAEGNRSFEPTQMLAIRSAGGWSAQDIDTPNEHGNGLKIGSHPEYELFTPDLALALLAPFPDGGRLAEPPLSPPLSPNEAGHQEKTVYVRDDAPLRPEGALETGLYQGAQANGQVEGNPGYTALVSAVDDTAGSPFGGELELLDATPDLSHAVIESKVPLTPASAPGSNLYEWSEGTLTLVNVLPGSARTPVSFPELGYQAHEMRNAISADGSRVFWSAGGHLYMTDMVSDQSIQLDQQQGGSGAGNANAVFQGASADGSRVFFTDQQQLTEGSGAAVGKPDLYVCEIREAGPGAPRCVLSDLSAAYEGESAVVQGLVLGTSEDGSTVYFMANGVLSAQVREEGAQPGQCRKEPQPNARCNLYVAHLDELLNEPRWEVRLVARLSNEDGPDWRPPGLADDLGQMTSRVSPNGRFLAFMSEEAQALTGYDNRDPNPEADGARDEEVFIYDNAAQSIVCASCDPSGARPRGVLDPPGAGENPEGIGLLVDRTQAWRGRWLAGILPGWTRLDHDHALYQSRYLSNSGRLFFESPADLVAAATNHKNDVYEYEPQGVPAGAHRCTSTSATFDSAAGGCIGLISSGTSSHESAFLDASEAGGEGTAGQQGSEGGADVFFITSERLAPQAAQSGYAVYDAHECTGAVPCLQPAPVAAEPCTTVETCRPAAAPSTSAMVVQTQTTSGSGNLAPEQGVKGTKTSHPKLTRAQSLRKALLACRRRYRRKLRRSACEARARHLYGSRPAEPKGRGR